jgi:ribonuclease HII
LSCNKISYKFEEALYNQGFTLVAGVDEAGRGPLAGPVVAAAVILPKGIVPKGINDSKKLSAAKRNILEKQIKKTALCYGIGIVEPEMIDQINILKATLLAMKNAVEKLDPVSDAVLVDGTFAPDIEGKVQCVKNGDAVCFSIAAASILAKVHRDRIMCALHDTYPGYGFDKHKGYPTAAHKDAIKKFGLCPAHRKTFRVK